MLPDPLFGPMSSLDTSFFDKLIDCVPLMVLYESAQTLESNVPLEVLNLSALLTSSIPEWYRLQSLRENFNSQMVTNFLERLTLCITFNTTDIPDHLPQGKFIDTEITCVNDIEHKPDDFKYQEIFMLGLQYDFNFNLEILETVLRNAFERCSVGGALMPTIGFIKTPRLAARKRLFNDKSQKPGYVLTTFPETKSKAYLVPSDCLMINEFTVMYPLYAGEFFSQKTKRQLRICFCQNAKLSHESIIEKLTMKENYPLLPENAIVTESSESIVSEKKKVKGLNDETYTRTDTGEGYVKYFQLKSNVDTNGIMMKSICDSFFDKTAHVVIENALTTKLTFGDVFRSCLNPVLLVRTFQKTGPKSNVVPDSGHIFMKATEFCRLLKCKGKITAEEYRHAIIGGMIAYANEPLEDSLPSGNYSYSFATDQSTHKHSTSNFDDKHVVSKSDHQSTTILLFHNTCVQF